VTENKASFQVTKGVLPAFLAPFQTPPDVEGTPF
jgi:hypothetical protein